MPAYLKPSIYVVLVAASLFLFSACSGIKDAQESKELIDDWGMVEVIVNKIQLPNIPKQDFDIRKFGAVEGEGVDALPAIQKAMNAAVEAGGGRVVIPRGTWLSKGPIHLKSKINLHVAEGATLLFGPKAEDYLPVVLTRWEGTENYGYSPLIYAQNVHDVAITGSGTLDGNADSEFHTWLNEIQEKSQLALRKLGVSDSDASERQFGKGHHLRPSMVQFFNAERVLLEDYTILNSPFWINHLVYTKHATVRGLNVDSHKPNNDGIDVDSSSYVLIENNLFRTGDDSVVIKSGRDLDGRRIGRPSEYVVVRNNDMGGEDGIALGSEMSGDIRYVYFTDNILRKGASAIRFKANLDRGGVVEHIRVRNMKVESFETLFWFQLDYPGLLGGGFPSTYRDIIFENFEVENADVVLRVKAPDGHPLQNVFFKNIEIKESQQVFDLNNVTGLKLENFSAGSDTISGEIDWK